MLNVLMVLGSTAREGAQSYVINILRKIDKSRYHIDFAVNSIEPGGYTDEILKSGSKIYVFPHYRIYNHIKFVKSFKKILDNNYDIVHGHVSSTAVIYLREAKKRGCVTIAHSHSAGYRGNLLERFCKKLYTFRAKYYADYWLSCSKAASIKMFGYKYLSNNRHYLIPNGIMSEDYLFDEVVRKRIREKHGINDTCLLVGHVGSFTKPKNHSFILELFYNICKERQNAKLVLIGDGYLKDRILNEIYNKNMNEKVIVTGNISNVNEYLMAMDVFIFPSLFEGFPMSLVEAQASGLYCVISDSISSEIMITNNISRISLKSPVSLWVKTVINIPHNNRKEQNKLIKESAYDISSSLNRLLNIYNSASSWKQ